MKVKKREVIFVLVLAAALLLWCCGQNSRGSGCR